MTDPVIHSSASMQSASDSMKMGCTSELRTRRRTSTDTMMDNPPRALHVDAKYFP